MSTFSLHLWHDQHDDDTGTSMGMCPCRRGQALDLRNDYLPNSAKQGKENAAPNTDIDAADNAAGNWPEVEIRVAKKGPGSTPSHPCSRNDNQ